jgi:hypothetical protein
MAYTFEFVLISLKDSGITLQTVTTLVSTTSDIILHIISLIWEHVVHVAAQELLNILGRVNDTN